jgi:hypothetical protein
MILTSLLVGSFVLALALRRRTAATRARSRR